MRDKLTTHDNLLPDDYLDALTRPYMGIDVINMAKNRHDMADMPHLMINQAGEVRHIKDADEQGWRAHPDMPQPNFTIGVVTNAEQVITQQQLDTLKAVRDKLAGHNAVQQFGQGQERVIVRPDPELSNMDDFRRVMTPGRYDAEAHDTLWDMLPDSYKAGLILHEQAMAMTAVRGGRAGGLDVDAAIARIAELEQEYNALGGTRILESDMEEAGAFYTDTMHMFGYVSPLVVAGMGTGLVASPLAGVGVATGMSAAMQNGKAMLEYLRDEDVDMTAPDEIKQALQDRGITQEMHDQADYEAVIGAARGLAAGLGPAYLMRGIPFGQIPNTFLRAGSEWGAHASAGGALSLSIKHSADMVQNIEKPSGDFLMSAGTGADERFFEDSTSLSNIFRPNASPSAAGETPQPVIPGAQVRYAGYEAQALMQ